MLEYLKRIQKYIFYGFGGIFVVAAGLGFFGRLPLLETTLYYSILHLVTGIFLAQSARQSVRAMDFWGRVFGVTYGVFAILGFTMPEGEVLGYFKFNLADNILHILIALPLLYYGFRPPDHKPRPDHDAEMQAELEKEEAAAEAEAAATREPVVRGSAVIDLKALTAKKPGAPAAPPAAAAEPRRVSDVNASMH